MIKILQGGKNRMDENGIKVGSKVRLKKEYKKKGEEIGLTELLTVKSVDSDGDVKFQEDRLPEVTIGIDWLELAEEEKI